MPDHPPTPGRGRLRKQGFAALALSAVFLAVALLLRPSPAMDAAAAALGASGLALLALGVVLLVLNAVLRRQAARAWAHTEVSAPPASDWNVHLLQDLTPQQFTALCVALFEQSGYDSRSEPRGADGSIDIWLHSRHIPGPATLARCKYMASGQVGLQELQALHGAMVLHGLRRASFITNATFTPQAQAFAGAHRILTRDGAGLLSLIERRSAPQQQALLDIAAVGDNRHEEA